ncbi:tetratricopeptide repeat protein [Methylibium sp.]|uniref:tetratricopeptide repeat protein n=1 Tax=Methylibium sp. TaxID=2067992 RepID=UPI003D0F8845
MRSADARSLPAGLAGLAVLIGVVLSGCAALQQPLKALQQVVAPAASEPAASVVPAAPVAAAVHAEAEMPVSPGAQRAYDDARKALRAGRTADAERGFRAIVKSNPELGGPHANLGLLLRQAGKLPEAVAELEAAVQANPQQPVYLNQLGIAYRQQGQFAKAREAYEKAIDLDPAYASPVLNLGILHDLYFGDAKRALELYDRYLALSPGGDAQVAKWVADLKNRKPPPVAVSRKEQP